MDCVENHASLSFTIFWSWFKFTSIESVMASHHFFLCHSLFLLPSVFPSIRVFYQWVNSASSGQSIGASASASVLPMNIQCWFPLRLTVLSSFLSQGVSRAFSSTTVRNNSLVLSLLKELPLWFRAFPGGSDNKESACNAGDPSSIRGLGRSPGGGRGNPLQYSCLENPWTGAWWATELLEF